MKIFLGILLGIIGVVVLAVLILVVYEITRPPRPRYRICMANRTPDRFDDVWVYYDTKVAAAPGHMVPGGRATYGSVTLPTPDEAVVTWTEANGDRHSPKVKLTGIVPHCPRDVNVWFIIEKDGSVTVETVAKGDIDASANLIGTLLEYREPY